MAINKSIRKWQTIKAAISAIDCPLCQQYKINDTDCGECPIKTDGLNCAPEYLEIHKAIDNFIKLLESKNG